MAHDYPPPPTDADAPRTYENVAPIRGRNTNGNHTAVVPHDLDAERIILAACLTPRVADGQPLPSRAIEYATAAGITEQHFYRVAHQHIWRAIIDRDGEPVDAVTVAAWLTEQGLADDRADVFDIAATPVVVSMAPKHIGTIVEHHNRRALMTLGGELAEYARNYGDATDPAAVVETFIGKLPAPVNTGTTSLCVDMQAVLEGDVDTVIPQIGPRDDHATCLIYAPGITWLSGEPGKGKTLLALWWAAQELQHGHHVLYLDFEGTAQATASRLQQMGCDNLENLSYIRRHEAWDGASLAEFRALIKTKPYTLCVIDAVAGAMEAEGLSNESNVDVEKWAALIPAMCFAAGMGVVVIDHVVKNAETRGRWMIGAQRKMARADVAYMLDMHLEAGIGRTGHGKLVVAKDRYGALAEYQAGRVIAHVAIASESNGEGAHDLRVSLTPPPEAGTNADGTSKPWAPTRYMEEVSRILEKAYEPVGIVELRNRIGKTKKWVDKAVDRLLDDGFIELVNVKGRAKPFRSVKPYREPVEHDVAVGYEEPPAPGDDDDPLF